MAVGPNRGQEVRVNGPIGAPGQMRMDGGFPGQPGPGMGLLNFSQFIATDDPVNDKLYCRRHLSLNKL